jgi:hypothetical protein
MNSREKHPICICTECLTVGHREHKNAGIFVMALVIIFGVIIVKLNDPITDITGISGFYVKITGTSIFCLGIFGAIWQMLSVKHVCPGCKKDSMIPVDTPKGRQLMIDAGPLVYERSIDATVPVTDHDHDVGANIQAKTTTNSVATINRTVGLFVICGLILSVLMWWKFGRMDKERITKIDFRNHTYSSAGFGSEPVTLKNGKFLDHGDFGTHFNSVEYADFNNDRENEAVVSIGTDIDGSAAYIEDYFVYAYQKEQLCFNA